MKTSTVLVLGGAGFIGSPVVQRLLSNSNAVRVFTRSEESLGSLGRAVDEVEVVLGDFSDDIAVQTALRGVGSVVHLISAIGPASTIGDGKTELESTIIPTVRLMENCAKAGIRKLVYVSSGGTVYGNADATPILESVHLEPLSIYGHSKKITESYIRFYANRFDIDASILRVANPFGPRQNPGRRQGIVAVAIDCLLNNKVFDVIGDGCSIRDYVFVEDVADGIVRALQVASAGTINISSGVGLSVLQMLELIESITGLSLEKRMIPARATDVSSSVLSNELALSILGWSPTTEIKTGLARTWDWIQNQRATDRPFIGDVKF